MKYVVAVALTSLWLAPLAAWIYSTLRHRHSSYKIETSLEALVVTSLFWLVVTLAVTALKVIE
jgi:hypothetical protein